MENKLKNPILVTGASGFIGANLVRRLVADSDNDIYLLLRSESNLWRLSDILPKVKVILVNLTDRSAVFDCIREIKPKSIFHLATYGAYPFQKEPEKIEAVNLHGVMNLLDACMESGFEIFINTGSSSEYGFKNQPMTENDVLEPNSYYAIFKAAATNYCRYLAQSRKKPIITLRLFSVYGPWEESTRLIPTLIRKFFNNECPPLVAPETARDYVYIDDVIDAYLMAADRSDLGGEIFNIGSGQQTTLREIVELTKDLVGATIKPVWGTMEQRIWDQNIWQANTAMARSVLGWQPRHDLRQGLLKNIDWQKEKNNLPSKMVGIDCPICGPGVKYRVVYEENLPVTGANYAARKNPDFYHYRMVKCDSCGLLYANSIFSNDEIKALYQKSKFEYNIELDNLKETYGNYLEKANKYVKRKDNLLEIGCGNGFFLEEALASGYKNVRGVEPSIDAVNQANPSIKEKIIFDVFRPEQLPRDFFDLACFFQVIEHMSDVNAFLAGCHNCLKPGGIFLGIGHDVDSLVSRLLKDKCPIINDEHVYVFNRETLRKIFEKNGFKVLEIGSVSNVYSLAYWLKLVPWPQLLRTGFYEIFKFIRLDKLKIKLTAGNIFIIAQKI